MELIKNKWLVKDKQNFLDYLYSLKSDDKKIAWTKNILRTNMEVLAIPSQIVKKISKEISKGNYESFLNLHIWDYYECTAIYGNILSQVKDFDTYKKYLLWLADNSDNWATCDTVRFDIVNNANSDQFLNLAKELVKKDKTFERRTGLGILFKLINEKYLSEIFNICNSLYNEKEYYVNMINAWLVCECFVKQRDKTLEFLKTHKLNAFTINKAIQKCRDSYRVTNEDKEMLLDYKIKN